MKFNFESAQSNFEVASG